LQQGSLKKAVASKSADPKTVKFQAGTPLAICILAGAVTGLSAPGFDQWFLAWIGLIPLLLSISAARTIWGAFACGTLYGLAYNLVYLNWYLHLAPLNWLGLSDWESIAVAILAWLFASTHQALIIGIFAAICKFIPLTGNYYPKSLEGKWHLPAILVIPFIWVAAEKLCNLGDLLGMPWSMLEYSQYKQLPIIQSCSLFGGSGLAFLIVLSNVAIACLIASIAKKLNWSALAATGISTAVGQLLAISLVVSVLYAWGLNRVDAQAQDTGPSTDLSIVQGNINIDMQKTVHKYTLNELMSRYMHILTPAPAGICVMTESALPTYLRRQPNCQIQLQDLAKTKHLDLVLGSMDFDAAGNYYNSAYGITSSGTLLSTVYHKRYLVPFGEYTPGFVKTLPDLPGLPTWMRLLTSTPAGSGFTAGQIPVVFSLKSGLVAPTICSEAVSPEVVAASVRSGGQLIINITDLAWFHDSMIGNQMTALSVIRAVENDRYFALAANSGPSVIVDNIGRITAHSDTGKVELICGSAAFKSTLTPFTQLASVL
jgi:apolipoprotein N-acyltransferase